MYALKLAFLAGGVSLAAAAFHPAMAKTCTAPGHSSCTITCPAGCIAMYTEPNGPCRTMCSGSAPAAAAASPVGVTIDAQGMSDKEVADELAKKDEKK